MTEEDASLVVDGVRIPGHIAGPAGAAKASVLILPGSLFSNEDGDYPTWNVRPHVYRDFAHQLAALGIVSTPITWDEVADVVPQDFTIATVPARYAKLGDVHAGIDDAVFDIAPLLEWADRDEREGAELPPEPDDDAVRLVEVPAETVAVLRFSGDRSERAVESRTMELLEVLRDKKIETRGEPVAWFYDPPWTVPFRRRNEVAVPVGS